MANVRPGNEVASPAGRNGEHDDLPLAGQPGTSSSASSNDISFGKLLKHHLRDWVVILIVACVEVVVYVVIPPFHRYVGRNNIASFKYPRRDTTVPTWSVLVIAIIVPLIVFAFYFARKRSVRDFHNAFLGLATAIALTALLTDSIKNTVGMPRPDFYYRCFPDHVENYDPSNDQVICHGSDFDIKDGYKSFPSGHASWSFAGLGFLSLYLIGKLGVFDKRGWSSRIVFVFLPLLLATLVAVSRVDNYQHSWWDVIFGAFLGLIVTYFAYRSHYPSVYSYDAGLPYKYIPTTSSHPPTPTREPLAQDGGRPSEKEQPDLERRDLKQ